MSSKAKRIVKISNPPVGSQTHVRLDRARRFINAGVAKFDSVGRLVFLFDSATIQRKLRGGSLDLVKVTEFSGVDAFPGSPVLPSWPGRAELTARRAQLAANRAQSTLSRLCENSI